MLSGPRRLDVHQAAKVQPKTLHEYRRAALPFVNFLRRRGYAPTTAWEWDDLVVEWKNAEVVSRYNFSNCVAAIEFFFPRYRGKLSWAHAVASGWAVCSEVRHTIPLCSGPAHLMAAHFCALRLFRLGFGLLFQSARGTRPGEMLGIRRRDVVLPSELTLGQGVVYATVNLGVRKGTKAKRPQPVIVRQKEFAFLLHLLERICANTTADQLLVPYSMETYRRAIRRCEAQLGIVAGWTPHSPRAGFASEQYALGTPFTEIKETGRWLCDISLRTYVDVISASDIALRLQSAQLGPAIGYCRRHIEHYFPEGCF